MDPRSAFRRGLARQLGHPAGLAGRVVGRRLNRRNLRTVRQAVDALAIAPGSAVADVGFGGGIGLELLLASPAASVHGVEISSEMLRGAHRRFSADVRSGRLALHEGPLHALGLPDASLDGLVTTNTIYFIADLAPAFAELARVLKPSGRAVIGIGDPDHMASMPFAPFGFTIRPVSDVLTTLTSSGLTLVDHQRVGDRASAAHLLVVAS